MTSISVLSWNIAGKLLAPSSIRFSRVVPYLLTTQADVICLQELYFARKRIHSQKLHRHYTTIIPPNNHRKMRKNIANTVTMTTCRYPEYGFFDFSDIGYKAGSVTWTTLDIGTKRLRIYNCRLPLYYIGVRDRLRMIRKVFSHASEEDIPAIVCGDMNTALPRTGVSRWCVGIANRTPPWSQFIGGSHYKKDERYAFLDEATKHGYREILPVELPTWAAPKIKWEFPSMKLDWFMVKGIDAQVKEIGPYISDHRPVLVTCTV